ncbi:MAG: transcription elongation factor GreA [Candidatus Peribacteraceae bacterium]|nr:transcription elongation factor GreA [Candidatus Peribacteraceae bacterium]
MTTDDDAIVLDDETDFSDNDDQTLVTREGLRKLQEELDHLKTVRRQEVAKRLKEAISYGDLSENSEYEEAKNEQAFVEGRILELERKVKNAKIISSKKDAATNSKSVEIGSTVTVRNRTENHEPETFVIVGSTEADPMSKKISNESPLGRAFLSSMKGEIVQVVTPAGTHKYEIIKVA